MLLLTFLFYEIENRTQDAKNKCFTLKKQQLNSMLFSALTLAFVRYNFKKLILVTNYFNLLFQFLLRFLLS